MIYTDVEEEEDEEEQAQLMINYALHSSRVSRRCVCALVSVSAAALALAQPFGH